MMTIGAEELIGQRFRQAVAVGAQDWSKW